MVLPRQVLPRAPPLHPPVHRRAILSQVQFSVSQDELDKRGDVCLFGFVQGEERMLLGKQREGREKKKRKVDYSPR